MDIKEMTKKQKQELLKIFFNDEIQAKAIIDNFSDVELNKWLMENSESLNPLAQDIY